MHKILIQQKDYDPSIEVDVNKVVNILKNGFILNDFVFILMHDAIKRPFPITVKVEPDKNIMLIAVFSTKNLLKEQCNYGLRYDLMQGLGYWKFDANGKEAEFKNEEEEAAAFELFDICLQFMIKILDMSYDRAMKYKKNKALLHEDQETAEQNRRLSNKLFHTEIMLFKDLVIYTAQKYTPDELKRKYIKPVWQVRGFYRHYKNGNVGFIKPFLKGRDRDKGLPSDNTYIAQ